jgi:hypothetical protein
MVGELDTFLTESGLEERREGNRREPSAVAGNASDCGREVRGSIVVAGGGVRQHMCVFYSLRVARSEFRGEKILVDGSAACATDRIGLDVVPDGGTA